jgi:hypothetical protein
MCTSSMSRHLARPPARPPAHPPSHPRTAFASCHPNARRRRVALPPTSVCFAYLLTYWLQLFDTLEKHMKGSRAQQQLDELFRFDKVQELRCDEVAP